MDALIAEPTAKKKRRGSGTSLNKDNNSDKTSISSPKASLPKTFSFYKDMIDEKVDQQNNDSDNVFNDDNDDYSNDNITASNDSNNESVSEEPNEESNQSDFNEEEMGHINVNITVPDITSDTSVTDKHLSLDKKSPINKIKPILTYVKKGIKKNVRFVDKSLIFV
jgi:hypothetical protein